MEPTARLKARPRRILRIWLHYLRRLLRGFWGGLNLEFFPGRQLFRRYSRPQAEADARAGLNVAMLGFPQSMAYALIAGLPVHMGLLSSVFGAMTGPLFTRSRFVVLGPTNATAIMIFSAFLTLNLSTEAKLLALPLFLALVGVFLILGALFRLSLVLNYVSRTVVTGYITAAASLIMLNQVKNALGLHIEGGSSFFVAIGRTLRALPQTEWAELSVALVTLAAFLSTRRWFPRLPNVAVALVVASAAAFGLTHLGWNASLLPGFSMTDFHLTGIPFDFELISQLSGSAMAVAFLSILEGSSIGKSLASRSGERLDINQEMYSMGAANIACAFSGGMNASGSLTRSALSWTSGAVTPVASIFSGIFVLLLLVVLSPLIGYIPKASLAVVVICIAFSLFNKHAISVALRSTRSDATVFFTTCVSALLFPLDTAIYIGAFTSILLFLRKAGVPELQEYSFNEAGQLKEIGTTEDRVPGIAILHAEGDLFFGSTEIFVEQARHVIQDPSLQVIVLRLKNARNLDATCVLAIEELLQFLRDRDRHMIVSGAHPEVLRVFRKSGLLKAIRPENFFPEDTANPTLSTRHALKRAQQILGRSDAEIRIFVDASREKKT